jgi:signal transduction histidine kinase
LREAQSARAGLEESNGYAITLGYLGDLALGAGQPAEALDCFRRAEDRARSLGGTDLLLRSWRGPANARSRLDQPKAARAQAAVGDYRAAYSHALAAAGASDSMRLEQARNRAIAMRARQELKRIQAEAEQQRRGAETAQANARAEQHRVLAKAEAARAAALQADGATLETLGQIGREITASLDSAAVFSTLNRHVTQLFDVTSFDVHLLDGDGRMLCGVFGIEAGEPSELIQIAVDDPTAYSARCVRERREVVIHNAPDAPCENLVPGTRHTLSLMFAPLLVGERVRGVMSIQSTRVAAYGERERSIFSTLCAYGAIALDNATAYASAKNAHRATIEALEELRQSEARRNQAEAARESLEAQLRESQKMQAIGTLAGGIAQDFNSILAVILGNVELARSDVDGDSPALKSLDEIRKAGERARDLAQRILSFSRRQPAVRKPLALSAVVPEAMRLLRATLPARLSIEATCAPNTPLVRADATLVQQVLINLCTNSMQAIPEGPGRIEIRLDCVARDKALAGAALAPNALDPQNAARLVRLVVRDDGHGVDAPTRARRPTESACAG